MAVRACARQRIRVHPQITHAIVGFVRSLIAPVRPCMCVCERECVLDEALRMGQGRGGGNAERVRA